MLYFAKMEVMVECFTFVIDEQEPILHDTSYVAMKIVVSQLKRNLANFYCEF